MSLNHYKLYIEQIFELVETIVIKSEDSANAINKKLILQYGESAVNPVDKKTWKYYLNLAGKYHPTDNKIYITSLDTLDRILFSAENLRQHTATAKAYEYGSRYYRELVSQHPADYQQLILGMLYPVDIDFAIQAPDFSVLGYPSKYIEPNEESLVININKWLANFKTRWFNPQYILSDNLYLANTLGMMFHQLVALIIDLRLRACKTSEAHSYHIREYLASHGMLDEYLSYITKKQALFFYRNINYIERNSGKTDTFEWLLDRVLTERDIPVNEINLSQDYSDLLTSYEPKPRFEKRSINITNSSLASASAFYTLNELLSKEINQAPGNAEYIKNNLPQIENKLLRSKTSFLKTKVLESSMVDYTDSGLYSIQDIALDHWCYMSVTNQYRAYINFNDTFTGQGISIPNHVAFLYFLYAYCQAYEIPVTTIPEFYVTRVAIDPVPSIDQLEKVVSTKHVSRDDLAFLLSLHTPLNTFISATSFHEFLIKTHISYKAQNMLAVTQNGLNKRAMIKNATYRLYKTARVESPYIGQSFESVLKDFGLRYNSVSKDEWVNIYSNIYMQATGLDINQTAAKAAMQEAMISLFKKLSSYSIQFLSEINKTTIRSINWSAIRMGNIEQYGKDLRNIKLVVFRLFKKLSTSKDYRFIELKSLLQKFYIKTRYDVKFIDVTINSWSIPTVVSKRININNLRLNNNRYLTKDFLFKDLPQFKPFYNLTEQQQHATKDIYRDWVSDNFIPKIDIDNEPVIPKVLRTDFMYPSVKTLDAFDYKRVSMTFDFRVDRNALDLNAYTSNFGTITAKAFKPFIKFHKNNKSFRLAPGKEEMNAPSFKYTGGIRYNPGFGFSKNLALDADFGDFVLVMPTPDQLPDLVPEFETRILNFFYNTFYSGINLGNMRLETNKQELKQFKLDTRASEINPGRLVAGSGDVGDLKFNINRNNIRLHFIIRNDKYDLNSFNVDIGSYTLGHFAIATGRTYLNMTLRYGVMNIGSSQLVKDQGEVTVKRFVSDQQTLKKFKLTTVTTGLGRYKIYPIINELPQLYLLKSNNELDKYKWSGADINNFINWPDNSITTEFELNGNYVADKVSVNILNIEQEVQYNTPIIEQEDISITFTEIVQELGTVEYDDVNKEIIFN